jgi:hypothetical protein
MYWNFKNTADTSWRLDYVIFCKKFVYAEVIDLTLKVPPIYNGGIKMAVRLKFENAELTPYCLIRVCLQLCSQEI